MTSKQNFQKPPPKDPKRPPYKFLRRTLRIGTRDDVAYKLFSVKRFYLKKIIDPRDLGTDYFPEYNSISRLFAQNRKLVKPLKYALVSSLFKPHVFENLKHCKNLQSYGFFHDSEYLKTDGIALYIKRLPPQIQAIRVNIDICELIDDHHTVYNIAKTLRRFPKLKKFNRWYSFSTEGNKSHFPRELLSYSQSVSRLKELNKLSCDLGYGEESGLKRAMRMGVILPGITNLKVGLSSHIFPHYNQMQPFFGPDVKDYQEVFSFDNLTEREKRIYQRVKDDFRREDEEKEGDLRNIIFKTVNQNEEVDNNVHDSSDSGDWTDDDSSSEDDEEEEEFTARCIMREEIKPFYRFELFPNLKHLNFYQGSFLYPLGPFVVDGFKALKNLESLKIHILKRSMGTKYIFQGLLHLPLLRKFSLDINFINPWDWDFLSFFLQSQKQLGSLSLSVTSDNSTSLRRIIENLENKPMLKSLELKSSDWPLEVFSKGLSQLNMTNQLHTFKFKGTDARNNSEQKIEKRIEGLCIFMKNQKESLKKLEIELPLVLEAKLVTYLAEAISQLTQLTDLHLELNYWREIRQTLRDKGVVIPEKWNPLLGKYLKRLVNLENLTLNCAIINAEKPDAGKWFVEVFQEISSLERLRKIQSTCYAWKALKNKEQKLAAALRELKNIQEIQLYIYDEFLNFMVIVPALGPVIPEILRKQALRTDLTF